MGFSKKWTVHTSSLNGEMQWQVSRFFALEPKVYQESLKKNYTFPYNDSGKIKAEQLAKKLNDADLQVKRTKDVVTEYFNQNRKQNKKRNRFAIPRTVSVDFFARIQELEDSEKISDSDLVKLIACFEAMLGFAKGTNTILRSHFRRCKDRYEDMLDRRKDQKYA